MEEVWLIVRGIGIGMLFSAPVGPVNVMCIREAFQFGFRIGLAAAFGAVTADVTFAALAAFGLTAAAEHVGDYTLLFQSVAAMALIAVGTRVARASDVFDRAEAPISARRAALTGFGMTATNPTTILGFVAVFGALGDLAPQPGDFVGAGLLVLGVATGGFGWWLLLVTLIAVVRRRMGAGALTWINRGTGGLLILFGLGLLARVGWVMLK